MYVLRLAAILAIISIFPSCLVQIVGLTHGMGSLSKANKEAIVFEPSTHPDKLYMTTGSALREQLKEYKKSIVYRFRDGCSADVCITPDAFETKCVEQGVTPIIVLDCLTNNALKVTQGKQRYGINWKYYKSRYAPIYVEKFAEDLTSGKYKENPNRFLVFEGGQFINTAETIEAALSL